MSAKLLARLGPASPYRVTIVTGPGGSGKTDAIANALAFLPVPCAHVQMTADGGELFPFVRALIDALRHAMPELGIGFPLAAAVARRSERPAHTLARWFAENLGRRRVVLAVDDLDRAQTMPDVREFVVRSIDGSSPEIRWIIGTRDMHDWPLQAWLARSTTGVPLVLEAAPETLSDDIVGACTRAWLATLPAASVATAGALARLPRLAEAILEDLPGARELLHDLRARFAFAFSGTQLRATVARAIAAATAGDSDVPARAERALARCPASIRLEFAVTSRRSDSIIALLDEHGFAMIDDHFADVVERAVDRLSPEARRTCAIAVLLEANRETERGRHDVAESWYLQAAGIARDAATRARVEFELGSDLLRRARPDCIEVLERVVATPVTPAFDVCAAVALGAAYAQADRHERARATIAGALARAESWPDGDGVAVRARIYRQAAYVYLCDSQPQLAARFARLAIELGERYGLDEIVAAALSVLLVVASSFEHDGDHVLDILGRLERCAQRLDNAFWLRYARLGQLEEYGERGAWNEVDRIEALLAAQELENDTLHTDMTLVRTRALRAAGRGDFRAAESLLRASGDHVADLELRAFRQAELATYAAAAGDDLAAAKAIAEADACGVLDIASAVAVRTQLQCALADALIGRRDVARARLAKAEARTRAFPRLRALFEALVGLLGYDAEIADRIGTLEALVAVHRCGLGGLGSVLAAAPLHAFTMPQERAS